MAARIWASPRVSKIAGKDAKITALALKAPAILPFLTMQTRSLPPMTGRARGTHRI